MVGPVEYLIVGFPGNQFNGEVAPALGELIDEGTIRLLDLVFITKDEKGDVAAVEFDEHPALSRFADLDGQIGGLIGSRDIEHAAGTLEPNSSAALLIWEDLWATRFVDAMRHSGGVLIESARVPHDLMEEAAAAVGSLN